MQLGQVPSAAMLRKLLRRRSNRIAGIAQVESSVVSARHFCLCLSAAPKSLKELKRTPALSPALSEQATSWCQQTHLVFEKGVECG